MKCMFLEMLDSLTSTVIIAFVVSVLILFTIFSKIVTKIKDGYTL